jgi:hypothetical protein
VLHMDSFHVKVRDPQSDRSLHYYGLVAVDGWTEHVWMVTAKDKVSLQQGVIDIINSAQTMTGNNVQQIRRVRRLRTDGGDEFINGRVKSFCRQNGIGLHYPPADNPALRGVAERAVRTVKDSSRTMLLQANVPAAMGWDHAAQHHAFLWNRTHVGKNTGKTPFEMMRGLQPNILHIGVFGCDVFVHQLRKHRESTFSPKALPGVYLGHDPQQNCPVVYMLHNGKKVRTRDVDFREGSFEHIRAVRHGRADEVAPLDYSKEPMDGGDQQLRQMPASDDVDNEPVEEPEEDEPAQAGTSKERYSVRCITDSRSKRGQLEYLVKWGGYPKPTWEPADVIQEDAPEEVRKYEEFLKRKRDGPALRTRSREATASSSAATAAPAAATAPVESGDESEDDMILTAELEEKKEEGAAASAAQRL